MVLGGSLGQTSAWLQVVARVLIAACFSSQSSLHGVQTPQLHCLSHLSTVYSISPISPAQSAHRSGIFGGMLERSSFSGLRLTWQGRHLPPLSFHWGTCQQKSSALLRYLTAFCLQPTSVCVVYTHTHTHTHTHNQNVILIPLYFFLPRKELSKNFLYLCIHDDVIFPLGRK
jgi:hypothetical protein